MKQISQDELAARCAIYATAAEIDTARNIAVLKAAGREWYAELAPVAALGDDVAVGK